LSIYRLVKADFQWWKSFMSVQTGVSFEGLRLSFIEEKFKISDIERVFSIKTLLALLTVGWQLLQTGMIDSRYSYYESTMGETISYLIIRAE